MEHVNASELAKKSKRKQRNTKSHKWNFSLGPMHHAISSSTMILLGLNQTPQIQDHTRQYFIARQLIIAQQTD